MLSSELKKRFLNLPSGYSKNIIPITSSNEFSTIPIKTFLLSQCVAFTTHISETLWKLSLISLPLVNLSCYHQSAFAPFP